MSFLKVLFGFITILFMFEASSKPLISNIDELVGHCDNNDTLRADKYGITTVQAISYGLLIQKLVLEKDMEGLLGLIEGELSQGPRKSFARKYQFDELFSSGWQERVLDAIPQCAPYPPPAPEGIFVIGNITYNTEGQIIKIGDTLDEKPLLNNQWVVDSELVNPTCFVQEWWSSQNYYEFARQFDISVERLRKDVGQLFGNGINDYTPITPGWEQKNASPKTISLINSLKSCNKTINTPEWLEGEVALNVNDQEGNKYYSYKLWHSVSLEKCSSLAPYIGAVCLESYFVELSNYNGGSIGYNNSYGVYGVFDLPGLGKSIVPLYITNTANEGLNLVSP